MSKSLATRQPERALSETTADDKSLYESLALKGDISGLKPEEKARHYAGLCNRLGLDPYTQPFIPLKLNNKEILYASRGATDQLARRHHVNREIVAREKVEDIYMVTVRATLPSGRSEESIGAVPLGNIKGDALANALMKAETKAKRRATLAILGLGMLDESELETIPQHAMTPIKQLHIPTKTSLIEQHARQEPVAPGEKREQKIQDIFTICKLLNEAGDVVEDADGKSVPWKSKSLHAFVNREFQVDDGLESLTFESLDKLQGTLNIRLNKLQTAAAAKLELQNKIQAFALEREAVTTLERILAEDFSNQTIDMLNHDELLALHEKFVAVVNDEAPF